MDGGTLMIQCRDFRQQEIKFCIDHRMGGEANWGDIYFGSIHPRRSGGVNLGKSKEWSQFIYSVAILDNHLDFFGYQSIDYWYPKIGEKLFNKIDEIYRKIIYDFKQIIKQIT